MWAVELADLNQVLTGMHIQIVQAVPFHGSYSMVQSTMFLIRFHRCFSEMITSPSLKVLANFLSMLLASS